MAWVQIHVPPAEIIVAFTYEDLSAGLSAKGARVQPESLNEDVRRAIERPDVTVRLEPPMYQATPLPPEAIARLGLPAAPPWLEIFGVPPERPWRSDPALTGLFHPEYPDDLEVTFFFRDGTERMWVHTTDVEPTIVGYAGKLLNAPIADQTGLTQGDRVTYRIASGALAPIWVSPAVHANLVEWSSACSTCGFDMLLEPAEDILARQFEGSQSLLAFTTRCPMCGQTMISSRRESPTHGREMSDPLALRATVRTVLHEHELVADRSRIAVGDTEVAMDAIDEVGWSWKSEPSAYKTYVIHSYEFNLRADSQRLYFVYEVKADWAARGIDPTAAAIIELLETYVYPRITRQIVGRLHAGESVTVAGLRLDRDGIYVGFRRRSGNLVDWGNVADLGIEGGKVVLSVRTAKGRELKVRTSTKLPNAVMLPRVLAAMQSREAVGAQPPSPAP